MLISSVVPVNIPNTLPIDVIIIFIGSKTAVIKFKNVPTGPPTKSTNTPFNFITASAICSSTFRASILLAKSSFPSALNCSAVLPIASWSINILDISSADIPNDLAKACCCSTFILLNSVKLPAWLAISSANPLKSPCNANALALSKLSCLPVNSSASNSASIDCSKFNNELAELATCSNSSPKVLATPIASAIASVLPPNWALICPVTLPVFSSMSL